VVIKTPPPPPCGSVGSAKTKNSKYKTHFSGKQQRNPIDWHNFGSPWNTLNVKTTSLNETSVTENQYAGIQSISIPLGDFHISHDLGISLFVLWNMAVGRRVT